MLRAQTYRVKCLAISVAKFEGIFAFLKSMKKADVSFAVGSLLVLSVNYTVNAYLVT